MGRSVAKRAVIVGCATLFAFGPEAVPAATAGPPAGIASNDLVTALSRDLALTFPEYLQRADTAQRLAEFERTARGSYPMVVRGVHLDKAGRPLVTLTGGPSSDVARAAAEAAGFTVETASQNSAAGADPTPVADDVAATGDEIPTPAAASDPEVPGGTYFYTIRDRIVSRFCVTAFNGTDRDGNVIAITGTHCDRTGPPDPPGTPFIPIPAPPDTPPDPNVAWVLPATPGQFAASPLGPRIGVLRTPPIDVPLDYGILRLDEAVENRFRNNLIGVGAGTSIAIDGIADPVVGAPVCRVSPISGFTCGTVTNADVNQTYRRRAGRNLEHLTAATGGFLTLPGDLGSPVISGTKALGIVSINSGVTTGNIVIQPIRPVLEANPGLTLFTRERH
ncbi:MULTISPECIES: S1 family peptidase [unclassified Nocardia]|uniref:S1 family peptidase n=1 Tax=unclassified Nocardia TaxID=2637762 RepID=UPI001CE4555C|nr:MULTISPECIES: S1 family peptidase [unclassified Nocardia]